MDFLFCLFNTNKVLKTKETINQQKPENLERNFIWRQLRWQNLATPNPKGLVFPKDDPSLEVLDENHLEKSLIKVNSFWALPHMSRKSVSTDFCWFKPYYLPRMGLR